MDAIIHDLFHELSNDTLACQEACAKREETISKIYIRLEELAKEQDDAAQR